MNDPNDPYDPYDPYEAWKHQAYCWLLCWQRSADINRMINKDIAMLIARCIPVDMSQAWSFGTPISDWYLTKGRLPGSLWSWREKTRKLRRLPCHTCLRITEWHKHTAEPMPFSIWPPNGYRCSKGHMIRKGACRLCSDLFGLCDECFRNKCKVLNIIVKSK
jgi:hypothetical protein